MLLILFLIYGGITMFTEIFGEVKIGGKLETKDHGRISR